MLHDTPVSPRFTLAALWVALMLIYLYADFFNLFEPGAIEEIIAGKMGPFDVSQGGLLAAAALMTIPALMIVACAILPAAACRVANLALGVLYTAVNIGNLIGESWAYYLAMGAVEIVLTLAIVAVAWRWPRAA